MKPFKELVSKVLEEGTLYSNGKGNCLGVIGEQVKYNIANHLPAVTGKKTNIKWAIVEMCMFLKGATNIDFLKPYGAEKIWEGQALSEDLKVMGIRSPIDVVEEYAQKTNISPEEAQQFLIERTKSYQDNRIELSSKIPVNVQQLAPEQMEGLLTEEQYVEEMKALDKWMEEPFVELGIALREEKVAIPKGYLGPIYGAQWRKWKGVTPQNKIIEIDQIMDNLRKLSECPTTRQAILTSWNPAAIVSEKIPYDKKIAAGFMGQPPCHVLYHFLGRENEQGEIELNTTLWLRSNDLMLGHPFNAIGATVLTHLMANFLGWKVGKLVMQISDAHLYEEHTEGAKEYLERPIHDLPTFNLPKEINILNFEVEDILKAVGPYTHEPYMAFELKTRVENEATEEQSQ